MSALPIIIISLGLIGWYYYYLRKDRITTDHLVLAEIKNRLTTLDPRVQELTFHPSDSTYTLNKKAVHFCLKDEKGRYYSENMLIRVAIHELAHALYPEDSSKHPDSWKLQHTQLLEKGAQLGLYDPKVPPVRGYCGTE